MAMDTLSQHSHLSHQLAAGVTRAAPLLIAALGAVTFSSSASSCVRAAPSAWVASPRARPPASTPCLRLRPAALCRHRTGGRAW